MSKDEYYWLAFSPSNPNNFKFHSHEAAQKHADDMNKFLECWDGGTVDYIGHEVEVNWNKEAWVTKPKEWIVIKVKSDE